MLIHYHSRKYIKLIAITLVILFFTPYTVKIIDTVHHHHYRYLTEENNVINFSNHSNICPIPGFHFHSFLFQKTVPFFNGSLFVYQILSFSTLNPFSSNFILSFSLRGPPRHFFELTLINSIRKLLAETYTCITTC